MSTSPEREEALHRLSHGARRHARERALGLLYEGELKELAPSAVLAGLPVPPDDYAIALVDELERPQHIRERFTIGY